MIKNGCRLVWVTLSQLAIFERDIQRCSNFFWRLYFAWHSKNVTAIMNYNIAPALVLSNSPSDEQNLYIRTAAFNKMTCAVLIKPAKFPSTYVQVPFVEVSAMRRLFSLNNPKLTWSLRLLPGKDVYFNVSILTLFLFIFIEYLYLYEYLFSL